MIDQNMQNVVNRQEVSSPNKTPLSHEIKAGNAVINEYKQLNQTVKELLSRIATINTKAPSLTTQIQQESSKIADSMNTEEPKSAWLDKHNDLKSAMKKTLDTAQIQNLNNIARIVAPAIEKQQATVDILVTVFKNHEETIDTLKTENAELRNEINNLKKAFRNEINSLKNELKTELKNEVSFLHSQDYKTANNVKNIKIKMANGLKQLQ